MFWISKIFQLAIDWQLNLDDLRIHQVIWLYIKGCDQLAEEVRNQFSLTRLKLKTIKVNVFIFQIIPVINNKENVFKQLLNVIKHRLKLEICINNLDYHNKIIHFSPEMISWLNGPVSFTLFQDIINY